MLKPYIGRQLVCAFEISTIETPLGNVKVMYPFVGIVFVVNIEKVYFVTSPVIVDSGVTVILWKGDGTAVIVTTS